MTESNRDQYIYKVLTLDQWAEFQSKKVFTGSAVDLKDGFIHMSCGPQLKETMDKWYSEYAQVAILKISAEKIAKHLKYEISRGGAEFPHLFAELPIAAVVQQWLVSPAAGVYSLPKDINADSKAI